MSEPRLRIELNFGGVTAVTESTDAAIAIMNKVGPMPDPTIPPRQETPEPLAVGDVGDAARRLEEVRAVLRTPVLDTDPWHLISEVFSMLERLAEAALPEGEPDAVPPYPAAWVRRMQGLAANNDYPRKVEALATLLRRPPPGSTCRSLATLLRRPPPGSTCRSLLTEVGKVIGMRNWNTDSLPGDGQVGSLRDALANVQAEYNKLSLAHAQLLEALGKQLVAVVGGKDLPLDALGEISALVERAMGMPDGAQFLTRSQIQHLRRYSPEADRQVASRLAHSCMLPLMSLADTGQLGSLPEPVRGVLRTLSSACCKVLDEVPEQVLPALWPLTEAREES